MKKRNPYQKRAEDAEALARALEKENTALRESGAVRHQRMSECIMMLDAAGMGKIGVSPYGNTLYGMVHEAVDLIETLRKQALDTANLKVKPLVWEPTSHPDGTFNWGARDPFGITWWAKDNGLADTDPDNSAPDPQQKADIEAKVRERILNLFESPYEQSEQS